MSKTVQLDIPILLPEVEDARDQCVARLREQLAYQQGLKEVHVDEHNQQAVLCVHYDPDRLTLAQVQRLAAQAGAVVTNRFRHEVVRLRDMDCSTCATVIEHALGRMAGVVAVSVNYAAEKMRLEYDSQTVTRTQIVARLRQLGYGVQDTERARGWLTEHRELVLSLTSGLLLLAGWLVGRFGGATPITLPLLLLAYATGGLYTARNSVNALRLGRFDIDVLMLVAALGAALLGVWVEGALLLFLFSLGHAAEHYAMDRARRAIEGLADLAPKTALVRRDGTEHEIPVEELGRGDLMLVKPGERIPADGRVVTGYSAVDQAPITGESVPVEKSVGAAVFAGTINGDGLLEVEVTRLATESTLAQVIAMVAEAETQKSPTQRFTEQFEQYFVPAVLASAALVMVVPPLLGAAFTTAFYRALTLLVAASPCALAIATPAAVLAAIARAAQRGVLIKGGVHLENLGGLEAMAFDKTGTITQGTPQVTDLVPWGDTDEAELLRVAAAVERRSAHPLAEAVGRAAQERALDLLPVETLEAVTGRGVRATLDGAQVAIGNLKLFDDSPAPAPEALREHVQRLEEAGKTTMVVQRGAQFLGIIGLADTLRPAARPALERLRTLGMRRLILLTGDNARVAAAVAQQVGIDEYYAELLPADKVQRLQELTATYGQVAMVGDGVNDAPAMASATVGIAMGGAGTDVALQTADVALMADDLATLPYAVALSRRARAIIRQNLWVALGVVAWLVPAALLGWTGIGPAVLVHEGSTIVVVLNALRLLGFQEREPA